MKKYLVILATFFAVALTACDKKADKVDANKEQNKIEEQNKEEQNKDKKEGQNKEDQSKEEQSKEEQNKDKKESSLGAKDDNNQAEKTAEEEDDSDKNSSNGYKAELTMNDFSLFKKIDDAAIPDALQAKAKEDVWNGPLDITGIYDMNHDGKDDQIAYHYKEDDYEAELKINDAAMKIPSITPMNAYMIDLDQRDDYTEFVLFDNGSSADPTYYFYRYDGKEIQSLGNINSFQDGSVCFDGYGRAVRGDCFLNSLDPAVLEGYYVLGDSEPKYSKVDVSSLKGQQITMSKDMEGGAYFKELQNPTKDFEISYPEEDKYTWHKGDKMTLNDMFYDGDYLLPMYSVTLSDGRTGMLYFWIGD